MSHYSGNVDLRCCRSYAARVHWRRRDDGVIDVVATRYPAEATKVYSPSAPAPYPTVCLSLLRATAVGGGCRHQLVGKARRRCRLVKVSSLRRGRSPVSQRETMMKRTSCPNLNHRKPNATVRCCAACGEVVNERVPTKRCSQEEHAARRRNRDMFCVHCGEQLRQ